MNGNSISIFRKISLLSLIISLCVSMGLLFSSCGKADAEIESCTVMNLPSEAIEIGKFDEAGIYIRVRFKNGNAEKVNLTESMMDDATKNLLRSVGTHNISFLYSGKTVSFVIEMRDKYRFNVTFVNAFGGAVSVQTIPEGESATAPSSEAMEVSGYRFLGTFDRDFSLVTENMTVKGKYVKTYEVRFYNAENVLIKTFIVDSGSASPEPTEAERNVEFYTFKGWRQSFSNVTRDLDIYGYYEYTHRHDYVLTGHRDATCTVNGYTHYLCSTCGDEKEEIEYAPGHDNIVLNSVETTCTTAGFTEYKCQRCNETYREDKAAYGHNYEFAGYDFSGEVLKITLNCDRCERDYGFTASSVTKEVIPATHSNYGAERLNYSVLVDGSTVSGSVTLNIIDKNPFHQYNGNNINPSVTYYTNTMAEVFGEDFTASARNNISCGGSGTRYFTCELCEQSVGVSVVNPHDYVESNVTRTNNYTALQINVVCQKCRNTNYFNQNGYRTNEVANCLKPNREVITYSVSYQNTTIRGEYVISSSGNINNVVHRHGDYYLSTENNYRMTQIRDMFEDGSYTLLGNSYTCQSPTGSVVFTCDDCNRNYALHVYDDHDLRIYDVYYDYRDREFSVEYQCVDCQAMVYPDIDLDYEYLSPTCKRSGYLKAVYSFENEGRRYEDSYIVENYPSTNTIHAYGDNLIDLEEVYTMAQIRQMLGNDFTELANARTCTTPTENGGIVFKCTLCRKEYKVNALSDHDYNLVEEDLGYYNINTVKEGDKIHVYLEFMCDSCDDWDYFEFDCSVKRLAPTSKFKGKLFIEYTYFLNGVKITKIKTIKVLT